MRYTGLFLKEVCVSVYYVCVCVCCVPMNGNVALVFDDFHNFGLLIKMTNVHREELIIAALLFVC